jgi:CBS domain-containing protein
MKKKKEAVSRQESKRESGRPGGGAGRQDIVGESGVYPMSGPHPKGEAPVVPAGQLGKGDLDVAGYHDSGRAALRAAEANPALCRDIMTQNPVCCAKSESINMVAQAMRENDIGSVAIVEDEKDHKLVGMVTDRDLAVRVLASDRDPNRTPTEEVMTREVVSCLPEDRIETCLEAMESHQIRRVPVVDTSGRIVGIISQGDIAIRLHEPKRTAEVVEEISRPSVL